MEEKYFKVDWPETQDFMILKEYKDFYTGYRNANDGTSSLFVPESIYNQFVDLKPTTMASLYKVNNDYSVVADNLLEAITKYNKYIEEHPNRGSIIKTIQVISDAVIN